MMYFPENAMEYLVFVIAIQHAKWLPILCIEGLHCRKFPSATAKQRICRSVLVLFEDDEEELQVTEDVITMPSRHYGRPDVAAATWARYAI